MKKRKFLAISAIVLTVAVLATSAIVWSFSPKRDLKPSEYGIGVPYEQVMKDSKPSVVMFYADWCTYCMRFMPKLKILSEIYKDKYNFVMVEADKPENEKLAEEYSIGGFPTLYIIDPGINNRISLNNGIYDDLKKVRIELDRYLRIRAMIK